MSPHVSKINTRERRTAILVVVEKVAISVGDKGLGAWSTGCVSHFRLDVLEQTCCLPSILPCVFVPTVGRADGIDAGCAGINAREVAEPAPERCGAVAGALAAIATIVP